jgi:fumarate reductase subunit C
MIDIRLYILQRVSALVMLPLVLGHILVMIHAIQGGLSAEEILSRTRGSVFWGAYYGLFVVAVSVHATIGLRAILHEWLSLRKQALFLVNWAVFLGLMMLGLRAVAAVVLA